MTSLKVLWLFVLAAITAAADNVTDAGLNGSVSVLPVRSARPPSSSSSYVSASVTQAFLNATIVISVVGILANGYVLLALVFSKNSAKSNVNVFITHQTVLDMTASVFLFIAQMLNIFYTGANHWLCAFIQSYAISVSASNASIFGLIIITIERYVKIVHPVAHRNKYRAWMTRAGIIIPWIFGFCMELISTVTTAAIVRGRGCVRSYYWPDGWLRIAWTVASFLILYLGPLAFFVYAYWKILAVIRRQRKQVEQQPGTSMSNAQTIARKNNRRAELNVIKTMVLVSVMFAACYFCMRTYSVLRRANLAPAISLLFSLFTVFQYSIQCLNPFIYASQYDVVRRWWKAKACRVICQKQVEEATIAGSTAAANVGGESVMKTTRNL